MNATKVLTAHRADGRLADTHGGTSSAAHGLAAFPAADLLVLSVVVGSCLVGCTSGAHTSVYQPVRHALSELDDFGALLVEAGLPPDALPSGSALTAEEARRLQLTFLLDPPSPRAYAPRRVADVLLRDVVQAGAVVPRTELARRLQQYRHVQVLRPDGYLVEALTGRPAQCVGPVEVRDGALRSGEFEVGSFYAPKGGGWQRLDSPGQPRPAPEAHPSLPGSPGDNRGAEP